MTPTGLLAVSASQQLGIAIAVILSLGWLGYIIFHLRRSDTLPGSEMELAPNRKPYYNDEILEGSKLNNGLRVAFILLVITAAGLALYWVREPGRQVGAERGFDQRSISRGEDLFQPSEAGGFGCATCHGNEGQGGSAPYSLTDPNDPDAPPRQVQWKVPPLNVAYLLFADPEQDDETKREEKIRQVIVYGRPNTPMPAWGVEGGGPMNEQQISDLVNYIESIQLTPAEARKQSLAATKGFSGARLFDSYCARCHTQGWSYEESDVTAGGAFGPSLRNNATVRQFPNFEEHLEFVRTGTRYGQAYGVRGVGDIAGGGMPGFAQQLTEAQIRAIVEYERSL